MSGTEIAQPKLRERQRAERERLILDEAERILNEEGYEGLTMDQLAIDVGVSKGTLYQHFAKKEDLVGAIMRRGLERTQARVAAYLTDHEGATVSRLTAVMTALIGSHGAWMSTINSPQRHELVTALRDHPGVREAGLRLIDGLSTLIRHGQSTGELDTAIPAPVATSFLLALAMARFKPLLPSDTTISPDEVAAMAVRLYFHGMCPSASDCGVRTHKHMQGPVELTKTTQQAGVAQK